MLTMWMSPDYASAVESFKSLVTEDSGKGDLALSNKDGSNASVQGYKFEVSINLLSILAGMEFTRDIEVNVIRPDEEKVQWLP